MTTATLLLQANNLHISGFDACFGSMNQDKFYSDERFVTFHYYQPILLCRYYALHTLQLSLHQRLTLIIHIL